MGGAPRPAHFHQPLKNNVIIITFVLDEAALRAFVQHKGYIIITSIFYREERMFVWRSGAPLRAPSPHKLFLH